MIRLCSTSYWQGQLVEGVGHQGEAVAEDVDIDVGTLADVAGPDAADQSRAEPGEHPHHPQGIEPHVAQGLESLGPLVNPGHRLDLVADLLVTREIARPMAILDAKLASGLALGGEVFGLGPVIHHLGGQEGDLAPEAFIGHEERCADFCPSRRRGARGSNDDQKLRSRDGAGSGARMGRKSS